MAHSITYIPRRKLSERIGYECSFNDAMLFIFGIKRTGKTFFVCDYRCCYCYSYFVRLYDVSFKQVHNDGVLMTMKSIDFTLLHEFAYCLTGMDFFTSLNILWCSYQDKFFLMNV